jgi:hypothetical protein
MPITPATLNTTPYVITHSPVNTLAVNGSHHAHDPADRKTEAYSGIGANLERVTFANNVAGNTYYLPFSANNIHSMRLPANPGFPALFVTANLDGCWIWVERKNNGDVVVYHANSSGPGLSPTVAQSATQPLFQTGAAQLALQALYVGARNYYTPAHTTMNWFLTKPRYLRDVNLRLLHKAGQGRTGINHAGPEHGSYTTFVGFYLAGHWEFWFQTFSQFLYRRPAIHPKSVFGHRNVNPHVVNDPYQIVEATRWLIVP